MNNNTVIYIIQNYLYNAKNRINTKRLNEHYFKKNNLEFNKIFHSQEKLLKFMKENNLITRDLLKNERYYFESKCKYCSKETQFIDINKGYKKFCNLSCSAKFKTKGAKLDKYPMSFKELVLKYLLSTNNGRNIIESQRLNEKWFKKNYLEPEFKKYKNILLNKKEMQKELIKCNLYTVLFVDNPNTKETSGCLNCQKETEFVSISKGYKKYCSRKCAAKYSINSVKQKETMKERYGVENAFQIQKVRDKIDYLKVQETMRKTKLEKYGDEYYNNYEQIKKSKLEKFGDEYYTNIPKQKQWYRDNYGVEWNSQVKEIMDKMKRTNRKTNEAKGNWITKDKVKDFKDYNRLVWRYTNANNLSVLKNIDKRGIKKNEYHLDHKYSIFQGFKDNIPAEIIGNICNLEMLNSSKNLSKNKKCSITKEDLLSSFENL